MSVRTNKNNKEPKSRTGHGASSTSGGYEGLRCIEILDALPFYVLLVDENHHIFMANRAVTEHLGVKPEDVVGRHCPEAIHGTSEPWYACPLEEAVEHDSAVVREAQDHATGRWISSAIYPIPGRYNGLKLFFHMVTDITDRMQAELQLKTSQEQLSELSRHLESVREEERTRIAREIHDELGQTLITLKVYLSWLVRRLPQAQEVASEQVKPMYALIDSAIQTVSRLSTELRPGALDDLGLTRAIEWQVNEFRKWTNLEFHVTSRPKTFEADTETTTSLFRIAHEAITNVVRHAGATRVDITLKKKRSCILMTVSDDGVGIAESHLQDRRAFGLMGMKERARLLGGQVSISGVPGHGTTVEVSIPQQGQEPRA